MDFVQQIYDKSRAEFCLILKFPDKLSEFGDFLIQRVLDFENRDHTKIQFNCSICCRDINF